MPTNIRTLKWVGTSTNEKPAKSPKINKNKMYQISYKNRKQKFPDIGEAVHGYKKTNYLLVAVIIGLALALIWITYTNAKKTDQRAKTYFQSITVEQPIKTSAQRLILQGE